MSDTMISMELKKVDKLTPDQLMPEDLIEINGDVVKVIAIDSDATGSLYAVSYEDDFGDKEIAEFNFDELISLYVYVEDDE